MEKKTIEEKRKIDKKIVDYLLEVFYIYIIEILFKIILKNFIVDWSLLRIFLSSLFIGTIISLITVNLKPVLRRIILIVFNFIVVLYAWLQIGFIEYLGAFISIGNAEQGTKITAYIVDFISSYRWVVYLIYIPYILFILYLIFGKKIKKFERGNKLNFKSLSLDIKILIFLILNIIAFMATVDIPFMQNKYQTVTNKALLNYPSSPSLAIKNFGTTLYLALDIKGTIKGNEEVTYTVEKKEESKKNIKNNSRIIDDTLWNKVIEKEENKPYSTLNDYYINRKITDKNDYTGILKGKNLIVLMLESVGYAVFDDEYKDYFPTLYKMYKEGISGVNNYSPRNNCATGESEMTAQLSLYSITTTCTVNTYRNNVYPEALMNVFKNNGYYTSAYHDYTDQYYYRTVYEQKYGSIDYFGVTKLGMTYNPIYREWPSDLVFAEKSLDKFVDKDHFASFMVTVTSHAPYNYSSTYGDKYLSLFEDLDISKNTKRFLSKVKEVDLALEYILKTLEEKGKLDDTVIVLFGDHYPYSLSDKEYASIAKYDTSVNNDVDRTPFIIYNSSLLNGEITKYTSPLDYTPTLLNLFGFDYDPRLYLGNDIFSDYTDFVLFPDNSWQGADGFYSVSKGEFIPASEETIVDDEKIIKINQEVNTLRNMSALTIKKNYMNYLHNAIQKERDLILLEEQKKEEAEKAMEKEED